MKAKTSFSALILLALFSFPSISIAQWEGAGQDYTPGDSRVPLCLLEKDGYIFFGDDHVGVFRIKEPITDTSNWVHLPIPGINIVYDLVIFDGKLWCTSYGNGVFSSEDNGATWQDRNAGLTHHQVDALTVCNNVLFCGTYHGGIFRYDNGTGMWAPVNTGFSYPPDRWYALELQTIGQIVYLYTVGIGMWYTTNMGEGWYSLNNMHYDGNAEVHDFIDHGGYLMIPADYLGVMRSINGGEAWDFCNEGMTSQKSVKSMAATDDAIFVGTSDSGVFMSKDHGEHWEMVNLGFPWDWQMNRYATTYSMEVIGDYLYAGIWYNGVMRAKLEDLYAGRLTVKEHPRPVSAFLDQNRPNPFTASTEISYEVPTDGPVSLKVFDLYGNEIATLVDRVQPPGKHTVTFRPSDPCGGGVYICRLTSHSATQTRKMILVK